MPLEPHLAIENLKQLRDLTGDERGAQRVAWTDTWEEARHFLRERVAPTGAVEQIDEAGNQWFTLVGASERTLVIGGHMDSVPNGGWLDGLRTELADQGSPHYQPHVTLLHHRALRADHDVNALAAEFARDWRPVTVNLDSLVAVDHSRHLQ